MVEASNKDNSAIGIDLGTTFSSVAVIRPNLGGEVNVSTIQNKIGKRTTPSVVTYHGGKTLIGESALALASRVPGKVLYDSKRIIGRSIKHEKIKERMDYWPFKVNEHPRTKKPLFQWEDEKTGRKEEKRPEYVSSVVLESMKNVADLKIDDGVPNRRCVVCIPAYFNDSQKRSTCDSIRMANL